MIMRVHCLKSCIFPCCIHAFDISPDCVLQVIRRQLQFEKNCKSSVVPVLLSEISIHCT